MTMRQNNVFKRMLQILKHGSVCSICICQAFLEITQKI